MDRGQLVTFVISKAIGMLRAPVSLLATLPICAERHGDPHAQRACELMNNFTRAAITMRTALAESDQFDADDKQRRAAGVAMPAVVDAMARAAGRPLTVEAPPHVPGCACETCGQIARGA